MVGAGCRMARMGLLCTFGVVCTFAKNVTAADTFRLTWTRTPDASTCPSAEKLAREVAAKLGRDPFDDAPTRPEIRGHIERHGDRWIVRIAEIEDEKTIYSDESPPLVADDCSEPHALAVHLITVFIQTGRAAAPPPRAPAPPPAPLPRPSTITPPLPPPPIAIAAPRRFEGHFFLGGGLVMGLLPTVAPAVSVSGGFGRGRFEMDAGMFLAPEAKHPDEPFAFGLTASSLGGCVRAYRRDRVTLLGCGHVLAGALHVVTLDNQNQAGVFDTTRPGDRVWVGFSLAPRFRFVIAEPFTLQLGADVVFPLRYEFVLNSGRPDEKTVFAQSVVSVIPFAHLGVTIF